jgi:hypothetical protein
VNNYTTSVATRSEYRNFSETAQHKKWSIPETYAQLKTIVAALPSVPDDNDQVLTFSSALRNPDLRRHIASAQPEDLEAAFAIVTNYITTRSTLKFGNASTKAIFPRQPSRYEQRPARRTPPRRQDPPSFPTTAPAFNAKVPPASPPWPMPPPTTYHPPTWC